MQQPLKTFIIYAREDKDLRDEFLKHVTVLEEDGLLHVWSDKEIPPGAEWNGQILEQIEQTDLFIPLVSVDFYASTYIRQTELPTANQRRLAGRSEILPVLVRDCPFTRYNIIKDLQVLPPDGKAVDDITSWAKRDKAWTAVVSAIGEHVEKIHRTRREAAAADLKKQQDAHLRLEKQQKDRETAEQRRREQEERQRREAELAEVKKREAEQRRREKEEYDRRRRENQPLPTPFPTRSLAYAGGGLLALLLAWFLITEFNQKGEKQNTRLTLPEKFTEKPNSESIEFDYPMVQVQGGSYTMGSPKDEAGRDKDECQHSVSVGTFSIGKYEVTEAQWRAIMGSNNPGKKSPGCEDCPVENESWNDIQDFLKKLNARTGGNYRLPTEEEWEFAARGGNESRGYKYAGSNNLDEVAWYTKTTNDKGTKPVGTKKANELGIHDMSGNVWEWCSSPWKAYPGCTASDWAGSRVLRGGSWDDDDNLCRSAGRIRFDPLYRSNDSGFRLARGG